mmetsp:Transcript_73007/g.201478  ORF Transcript_73007/g.201478 Transcript_73007/m.201478 type:complete len:221 (-) Transcript_73007:1279-1941(-)
MRSSLLSISNIMPVILPASSGWYLAIAGKSFSPIICFCTEGGAAASAAALRGPPGAAGAPCGCWGICWPPGAPGAPGTPGRGGTCICGMGGRIIPMPPAMGPPMGVMPVMPIMPGPLPPGIIPGPPLPIMPIICGPPIMGPRGPIMAPRGPYMAAACGGIMPIICGPPLPIMPMAMGMGPWKPCPPPYICGIMPPLPSLPPVPLPPLGPPGPGMLPAPGE